MKFRAHETFFIRKGWLFKGLKNVKEDPSLFIRKDKNPVDTLGLGSNMVKSLRYWLQATGITTEDSKSRFKDQHITQLGDIIFENDRYFEEIGTLCLIHYKLASNDELATSWFYFFNEFKLSEFQKDDFTLALQNYLQMKDVSQVAQSSLEDDFNCIINSYVLRKKLNPTRVNPESNIECPLDELGLVEIVAGSKNKDRYFKKVPPKKGLLPSTILMAIIKDIVDSKLHKSEIRIEELLSGNGNIGKLFNFDEPSLYRELDILAKKDFIDIVRTAGLDLIKIKTDKDFYGLVKDYYASLNGK